MKIKMRERVGAFAENKDIGKSLRENQILPALNKGQEVILDFDGVESATQSFIHSLISDVLRQHGDEALDKLKFKSCSPTVKKMVGMVVDYMQDAMQGGEEEE